MPPVGCPLWYVAISERNGAARRERGRPLRRLCEPMGGNLRSFREFFSRKGKSRRSGEPDGEKKHDTEKGHRKRKETEIKKASRNAYNPNGLKIYERKNELWKNKGVAHCYLTLIMRN